jgi:hypothetical protein
VPEGTTVVVIELRTLQAVERKAKGVRKLLFLRKKT